MYCSLLYDAWCRSYAVQYWCSKSYVSCSCWGGAVLLAPGRPSAVLILTLCCTQYLATPWPHQAYWGACVPSTWLNCSQKLAPSRVLKRWMPWWGLALFSILFYFIWILLSLLAPMKVIMTASLFFTFYILLLFHFCTPHLDFDFCTSVTSCVKQIALFLCVCIYIHISFLLAAFWKFFIRFQHHCFQRKDCWIYFFFGNFDHITRSLWVQSTYF